MSRDELERLLATGLLVVVDEAYIEFAGTHGGSPSAVPLVREHENLVVLRTFSKWAGLAGLRAGYGVMSPVLASVLMTIKQPYNLNVAAGVAMIASIEDRALLDERACMITGTRERLAALLARSRGSTPYPSEANFILCRLDGVDAVEVKERLAKRGIFVRHFDSPRLRNHLRISVGLEEHNAPVVRALHGDRSGTWQIAQPRALAQQQSCARRRRRASKSRSTSMAAAASSAKTGIGMLDHLVEQIGKHGLFDLTVTATGDLHVDEHHTVEDVGIALGQAIDQALGDRGGHRPHGGRAGAAGRGAGVGGDRHQRPAVLRGRGRRGRSTASASCRRRLSSTCSARSRPRRS